MLTSIRFFTVRLTVPSEWIIEESLPLGPRGTRFFRVLVGVVVGGFFDCLELLLLTADKVLLLYVVFTVGPRLTSNALSKGVY